MNDEHEDKIKEVEDEEVVELMKDHDLEREDAEEVRDLMDELGVDESDAIEINEEL